VLNRIKGCQWD